MRALFYLGDRHWTARARVFLAAARGLAARGHQTTIVCSAGTPIVERIAGNGVETVLIDAEASVAGAGWELRRTLQDRFVEVAFVHTEREQLVVSSAMRLAERGAVVRRIAACTPVAQSSDRLARRLATAGLLFATEQEAATATDVNWQIPPSVARLGVDAPSYDGVVAAARATLGAPPAGILIGCPFDATGRVRLANVMRTLRVLGARRPDLHVVVFGPDSDDQHLRLHAAAVGVTGRVTFLGDPADPRAVMRACDLVWIAADGDAGAFGLLDAMALRLPIVAERTPLAEYFAADGLTGVLLPPADSDLFASNVAAILGAPERRTTMGTAGRARVQRDFTDAVMIDGFEKAGAAAGDRTRWAVR